MRDSLGSAMSPSWIEPVEWRFGAREEDIQAWLQYPGELHMIVHFRPPTGEQWHSIMTVTVSWLRRQSEKAAGGGIWPALLIVPDGPRGLIESKVAERLSSGWKLIVHNAQPLPGEPVLPDPDEVL